MTQVEIAQTESWIPPSPVVVPQDIPDCTRVFVWQVPMPAPASALCMQKSPKFASHEGRVAADESHAAPTVAPAAWQVPVVLVDTTAPTHESVAAQGVVPGKHAAPVEAYTAHTPTTAVVAPSGFSQAML